MSALKDKWTACDPGDYTDYNGNSIVVLGEDDTRRIAVVMGSDDYAKEAARLIAASPDLMELLLESQSFIGGDWRKRRDALLSQVIKGCEA